MQTLAEIIDAILAGAADENLDAVTGAIKDRRAVKARSTFHTVKKGDRATLKNLRPKYMVGVPVIVESKAQTRINVKIDPEFLAANPGGVGRFSGYGVITCTPDMLDLTT